MNHNSDDALYYDSEYDDFDDEDIDDVNDYGFGRPRPAQRRISEENVDTTRDNGEDNKSMNDNTSRIRSIGKQKMRLRLWGRNRNRQTDLGQEPLETNVKRMQFTPRVPKGLFGWNSKKREEMEIQLEEILMLRERSANVEAERDQLETDYDDTLHRLKDAQKQLGDVTRTNSFLKNQLKDSKKILEQAVITERQKTNTELARVRDQMVSVLERERRIMRAQLMKSSAEVRSMIDDQNEYYDEGDF